jgi:hypothetical protein
MSILILTYYRTILLKIAGHQYRLAGVLEPFLYMGIGTACFIFMTSILFGLARGIWG